MAGEQMLKKLGYKVIPAESGKEALEIFSKDPEKIDLVLLDMVMPDISGGETYTKLKEIDETVKVLLSSGYSLDGQAREIMDRGCNGFIQKPFNLKNLSQKVKEVMDGLTPFRRQNLFYQTLCNIYLKYILNDFMKKR